MKNIIFEERTKNFRISHIVQKNSYNMKKQHLHREYEIYYLIQGERFYFIDGQTYHVNPGSLVLVPSGTIHRTTSVISTDSHERILLILNEEWMNPFLRQTGMSPLDSYFNQPVIQLDSYKQKYLRRLYDDIYQEMATKQANYEVAIKMKLTEILILISRCSTIAAKTTSTVVSKSAKHTKVNEASMYIKEHFMEPISLQQIADHIFVSRGYLSNIFNEVTGFKLTEYINIQRINHAKELLANSDDSITDIAGNSGFESITYFEKIFRQTTGVTPLKYRQSMQPDKSTKESR